MLKLTYPEWMTDAACRGVADDCFFGPDFEDRPEGMSAQEWRGVHSGLTRRADLGAKIRYCLSCPVRSECARYGWNEDEGVYGGLTPRERRAIDAGENPAGRVVTEFSGRRAEVVRWFRRGLGIKEISERLGVTEREISRYLREEWTLRAGYTR